MQTILGIDIETYSSIDITKSGVYKYVESPDFEVLLFAYSLNNAPVQIIDLTIDELPMEIEKALTDSNVIKTSWNSNFERVCLAKHLNKPMPPEQWRCTMVHAAMVGLPLSLDAAAKVLKLDVQKDSIGKSLIRFFSVPSKPSKVNGGRTRNLPEHAPAKWEQYKAYCVKDVEVEQAIAAKIAFYQIPPMEQKVWELDQKINDNGVALDLKMVQQAIKIGNANTERLLAEAIDVTGLGNPNSVAQLKNWLQEETGEVVEGLTKKDIPILLKAVSSDKATRVLQIRQEMAKTSVKKYNAMQHCICADGRVRGLTQYGGANRTLRWAGRLIQLQNLPKNKLKDLDLARRLVVAGNIDNLELLFGNVPDTLSQLIRTAFIAPKGCKFIVSDFSAIEAVALSWLAGERWRLDVFRTHGKIYESSASAMFGIPLENITEDLRQKGKVAELALGYSGGPNALVAMGALSMGIAEEELPKLVKMWRNSNKAITKFWFEVEAAAIKAVENNCSVNYKHGIKFIKEKGCLFIQLPSGRRLSYLRPRLEANRFDKMGIVYEGMDQNTKRWGKQETYSGKLTENIVQAVARDLLAEAMLRLDAAGYATAFHVHDEVVIQADEKADVNDVSRIMGEKVKWAPDLPLKAKSYETNYYKKD